ncbi:MAG: ABC transporter ATP-binding protein [Bacteroidota bacterium]
MRLVAENLNIGYGNDKIVFPDISFSADEREMIALLGVNGIGKSTLLRTISGLQKSVSGIVKIGERSLEDLVVSERAKLIGIVLTEKIFVDNISVRDFISLGRSPYTNWLGRLGEEDISVIERVVTLMKIEKLLNKLFNQLSDGEKQKVLIARVLCQQTPVIILDEPTAFLDFKNKKEVLELLSSVCREMKKIIILSTHDVEASLQHCDKCWIMTEGRKFTEINRTEKFKEEVMNMLFTQY